MDFVEVDVEAGANCDLSVTRMFERLGEPREVRWVEVGVPARRLGGPVRRRGLDGGQAVACAGGGGIGLRRGYGRAGLRRRRGRASASGGHRRAVVSGRCATVGRAVPAAGPVGGSQVSREDGFAGLTRSRLGAGGGGAR